MNIAEALGHKNSRGRPSISNQSIKKIENEKIKRPVPDVRYDGMSHFSTFGEKKLFKYYKTGVTRVIC